MFGKEQCVLVKLYIPAATYYNEPQCHTHKQTHTKIHTQYIDKQANTDVQTHTHTNAYRAKKWSPLIRVTDEDDSRARVLPPSQ